MKPQLSKKFKKRFWNQFDAEFKAKPIFGLKVLAPALAFTLIFVFVLNREQEPIRIDPAALQIAIEIDESYGAIYDDQIMDDDSSSWLSPESLI